MACMVRSGVEAVMNCVDGYLVARWRWSLSDGSTNCCGKMDVHATDVSRRRCIGRLGNYHTDSSRRNESVMKSVAWPVRSLPDGRLSGASGYDSVFLDSLLFLIDSWHTVYLIPEYCLGSCFCDKIGAIASILGRCVQNSFSPWRLQVPTDYVCEPPLSKSSARV